MPGGHYHAITSCITMRMFFVMVRLSSSLIGPRGNARNGRRGTDAFAAGGKLPIGSKKAPQKQLSVQMVRNWRADIFEIDISLVR